MSLTGNSELNQGATLTLTCIASISNPAATLTWYRNGNMFTVSSMILTPDGSFGGKTTQQVYSIPAITKDANGTNITCTAISTARTTSIYKILNVRCKIKHFGQLQCTCMLVLSKLNFFKNERCLYFMCTCAVIWDRYLNIFVTETK